LAEEMVETVQIGETCSTSYGMSDQEAEHFAFLFKAISHPVRVKMLDIIYRAESGICVCDVEASFDLTQPTISHHLKILRDAGLIESEQRGLWVYHRIRPETFATVQSFLEGFH
jgi:ArsR family transcriptional regulator